ncbi:MAG: PD40 domain-containing protein, partial [Planctomycetaceae bacterium]|nr:PD40 domain-containing protein [Planctomycetaceae bacterium]
ARSDLFSLGCVLYALCAGRSPFHSDSVLTSLRLVCDSEPTPLQQVVEEVPDWFARLVHSLLQKKPDDRIQSAEEVEAILTAHLSVLTDTSAIPHSELPMSSVARGTDICQDGVFGPTHAAAETLVAEPMPASRRLTRKVAVTAALISLLCLTETSGITHLAGLVVRISRDVPFRVESATTADTEPVGDNTFTVKLAHGGKEVGTLSYTPEDSGTADARTHRAARNRKAETPPPPMAKPESHTEPTVNLLGTWTVPERLTIRVHEHEITGRPWISADGLTILFESDRAGSFGRTDVWMAVRSTRKQPFGAAVNLGTKINTSAKEADPCLSPDGMTLFFNATPQRGGHGRSDLWMATRSVPDGEFDAAVNVGPLVNSDSADTGAVLSADGLVLMFASAREGSFGDEDLWICQRPDLNSPWQPPQNAGSGINTEHRETSPELSADGLQLWFVSDRPGTFGDRDLWIAVRPSADEPFGTPVNAGPGINTDGIEESPTLTADGRLLLFESSRRLTENDPGLEDIWMSELISITE